MNKEIVSLQISSEDELSSGNKADPRGPDFGLGEWEKSLLQGAQTS